MYLYMLSSMHVYGLQNQLEAENTKELQAEQKDKGEVRYKVLISWDDPLFWHTFMQLKEEVEQLKMECTEAINKLKAAEQFEEMVKVHMFACIRKYNYEV